MTMLQLCVGVVVEYVVVLVVVVVVAVVAKGCDPW